MAKRYSAATATAAIAALLRDIAEANALVDAANAARSAGAAEIPRPEAVRSIPGLPWVPDEVETAEPWAFPDGSPVGAIYADKVVHDGGGRGSFKSAPGREHRRRRGRAAGGASPVQAHHRL